MYVTFGKASECPSERIKLKDPCNYSINAATTPLRDQDLSKVNSFGPCLWTSASQNISVETNLFFERIRISNLIRNPEFFRIRIRILFVVRKFSNPNPNIRGSGKKIRI